MKSVKLHFSMIFLLASSVFAQDPGPYYYVSGQRGDTLIVKDDVEFGGSNVLYLLMQSDTLAPSGRVYMLKNGGIYSLANNPVTSSIHRTVIMGQSEESVKTRQGAAPPIICGAIETNPKDIGIGIIVNKDLLIKNCEIEIANPAGDIGWGFFFLNRSGNRIQIDNCIIENHEF